MFSKIDDSDRIIPRRRANLVGKLFQGGLSIFLIIYIGLLLLGGDVTGSLGFYTEWLFIPFIVVGVILPVVVSMISRWRQKRAWEEFASSMGFQVTKATSRAFPVIGGTFRGHKIALTQTSQQRGRSRMFFTSYVVTLPENTRNTLTIKKRSLTNFNRSNTGDEEIDGKFEVKASSKKVLDEIITTNRLRQGLLDLAENNTSLHLGVEKKSIRLIESGQVGDPEYLTAVLRYLVDIAYLVERSDRIG